MTKMAVVVMPKMAEDVMLERIQPLRQQMLRLARKKNGGR